MTDDFLKREWCSFVDLRSPHPLPPGSNIYDIKLRHMRHTSDRAEGDFKCKYSAVGDVEQDLLPQGNTTMI